MIGAVPTVEAERIASLPEALHHRGEPTAWTRVTRPGLRLHSFLEGLVVGPDGDLYLVDVPHGRIFCVDAESLAWRTAFSYDGEPHGLAFRPDGKLVITDYRRGLLLLDLQRAELTTLCHSHNMEGFRGLSDLVIDGDGQIWFTDSGRSSLTDPTGRLFRLSADASVVRCVLDNIPYPNGIAIGADGASVFVAATRGNAVWRLARALPDNVKPMAGLYIQLSGGLGPDGLAVAPDGRLAVAHAQAGCAWLFDRLGQPLARVTTPGGLWTTSVRFSGDGARLYIVDAQSGSIYRHTISSPASAQGPTP